MSFAYYSPVTVQPGQVPSTQTDFPMLVSYIDARLKTVGNGGHVQNANGYDVYAYSDSALTTRIPLERQRFNASTGEFIGNCKVGSLADGSIIYLAYGDAAISTDPNLDATYGATSVWNSNFSGVWHLPDGTTLTANDSTANADNLASSGSPAAGVGKVDGGASFNGGASQNLNKTSSLSANLPDANGNQTWILWFTIGVADTANRDGVSLVSNAGSRGVQFGQHGGNVGMLKWGGTFLGANQANPSINTLHSFAHRWDGTTNRNYYDGSALSTDTTAHNSGAPTEIYFSTFNGSGNLWNGILDEVQILKADMGANWITTTYNNQSAPSTFAVLGTEVILGISFDAASNSGEQLAQSTYSWSHICTGSNRYLKVGIGMLSLAQTVSGITYNSVALTFLGARSSVSGAARIELWGLAAPATGSNSIAVTLTGAVNSGGVATSYAGVHQTSPTEGFNSAQATNVGAADATVNVTTVADNDWVIDGVVTDDTSIVVGAGQISRNNISGTVGSIADSDEGPKTPAGSVTMSWTNIGAAATWAIAAIALRPVTASYLNINYSTTKFLNLLGVGI